MRNADISKAYVLTIDVEIDAGPKWKMSNPGAAREIAEEYFDSDKVLTKVLSQIGC